MKHGRISFLTDRGPILGTSTAVVFVLLVSVASFVVTSTISRVGGRERSILARGCGSREMEIQEIVCVLLLASVSSTLLILTLLRVATHIEL